MTAILMIPACEPETKKGTETEKRLLAGLQLWNNGNFEKILVCGGVYTSYQIQSSARSMKEWLIERGVASKNIVEEDSSRDTYENIDLSVERLREYGFLLRKIKIHVITQWQHSIRIWICFLWKYKKRIRLHPLFYSFNCKEILFFFYHLYDPGGTKRIAKKNREKRKF